MLNCAWSEEQPWSRVNSAFLLPLQMTNVTKEHCLEIISKFEPCLENKKEEALGIDGKLAAGALAEKKCL